MYLPARPGGTAPVTSRSVAVTSVATGAKLPSRYVAAVIVCSLPSCRRAGPISGHPHPVSVNQPDQYVGAPSLRRSMVWKTQKTAMKAIRTASTTNVAWESSQPENRPTASPPLKTTAVTTMATPSNP